MSSIKIINGRVICPEQNIDRQTDLHIKDGKIAAIGTNDSPADEVIDASGMIVCPGLIDMHVHFRDPGDPAEETIASGCAAAVAGGFTTVVTMPNTNPAIDTPASVEYVLTRARQARLANVYPAAAITKGRLGQELTEMSMLTNAGVVAFTDDGSWVASASVMANAMKYASLTDRVIISHCEEPTLAGKGVMNAGPLALRLGLPGMPRTAEEIAVARDIILAGDTKARLHLTHVSTAGTVELIRRAKADGIAVTADVTPHHLTLTEESVATYDATFKMNPPLRTPADIEALVAGLLDGTIDAIASDHAPHAIEEKVCEFDKAAPGVIGLETTLAMLVTEFILTERLTWPQLVALLTINPAKILGIPKGTLEVGADADVVVIDPAAEWKIDAQRFASMGRNCPFDGRLVTGRPELVIIGGIVKEV